MQGRILYVVSRPVQINTSASIRNKATIMGLVENGYQVDLVTTAPDKNHMAFDSSMELAGVKCQYIELGGVQSLAKVGRRFKFLRPLYIKAISLFEKKSIYDNLSGIVSHTNEVDLKEGGYDLIISSSDPKSSHLFVEKLLKEQGQFFHGKWIQIWGDPFYDDITLPASIDKKEVYKEEERLILGADKVVYVSKLTLNKQRERYSAYAGKMEYYPIPYNKVIISDNTKLNEKVCVSLAYCGDYGSTVRNIIPFYDAVTEMDNVHATIYGGTDLHLEEKNKVTIKPRQPMSEVERVEGECDILVHLSNLHGGQIPGKLYQYSGTNKPILFILDGDCEQLRSQFEKYDRYVFADNNKEAIKKAIRFIKEQSKEYEPVPEFSKKVISEQIVSFNNDNRSEN